MSVAPHNIDAEECVLGGMLMSRGAVEAVSFLDADDFYREDYGLIFRQAMKMHVIGETVDPVTMAEAMPEQKEKLYQLLAGTPASANARQYALIVQAKAKQRRNLRVLSEATRMAEDGNNEAMQQVLQELDSEDSEGVQIVTMVNALQDLEEEIKTPPERIGIEMPFSFLKEAVGGRVYVLAGYQGEGKTAIYGQIIAHAAQQRYKVGAFTLEMTWRDLRDRFVASRGVPYEQLQERRLTTDFAKEAYKNALTDMALWNVEMIDKGDLNVADIRRTQKLQGYDIILIDHLHRFDWRERRDIERIMRGIVNIAKEFNVPIILLAQLRRPLGTDRSPRPTMSMLRESGMIEAEAALVSFVYRPRNDEGLRHMDAEFIIAKNRYGEEGLHKLIFVGEQVRFIEGL